MSSENKQPIEKGSPEIKRLQELDDPLPESERKGFLPFDTNLFDRYFVSIVCLIAIHLLWMRFIEAFIPIGFATVISLVLAYVIIRRG
jgi:predicted small integral membrane protein